MSVIVEDANRRPLPGLTSGDLRVLSGSGERPIEYLRSTRPPRTRAPFPKGSFSNRFPGGEQSATVILIDALNTPGPDLTPTSEALQKVMASIAAERRVGLYRLTDHLETLHSVEQGTVPAPESLKRKLRFSPVDEREKASITLSAMENLAALLSRGGGRRNLIWLCGGLRVPQGAIETLGGLLAANDIALYAVDVRGRSTKSMDRRWQSLLRLDTAAGFQIGFEPLVRLAEQTGGSGFRRKEEIGAAVDKALSDALANYTLAFTLPATDQPEGFEEIRIETTRPAATVRYMMTHLSTPVSTGMEGLVKAARNPMPVSQIGLTVSIYDAPDGDGQEMVVTADRDDLTLVEQDGRWRGQIEMLVMSREMGRLAMSEDPVVLNVNLPPDQYARVLEKGLGIRHHLRLAPGKNEIRLAVRDVPSGALGSMSVSVSLPPHER